MFISANSRLELYLFSPALHQFRVSLAWHFSSWLWEYSSLGHQV